MGVHPPSAIRLASLNLPNPRSKAAAAPPPPSFPFPASTRRRWAALGTGALAKLMALLRWKKKHGKISGLDLSRQQAPWQCSSTLFSGFGGLLLKREREAVERTNGWQEASPARLGCCELPLPEGWEEARDYDIDHATKTTSWVDPWDSHWAGLFRLGLPRWPLACLLRSPGRGAGGVPQHPPSYGHSPLSSSAAAAAAALRQNLSSSLHASGTALRHQLTRTVALMLLQAWMTRSLAGCSAIRRAPRMALLHATAGRPRQQQAAWARCSQAATQAQDEAAMAQVKHRPGQPPTPFRGLGRTLKARRLQQRGFSPGSAVLLTPGCFRGARERPVTVRTPGHHLPRAGSQEGTPIRLCQPGRVAGRVPRNTPSYGHSLLSSSATTAATLQQSLSSRRARTMARHLPTGLHAFFPQEFSGACLVPSAHQEHGPDAAGVDDMEPGQLFTHPPRPTHPTCTTFACSANRSHTRTTSATACPVQPRCVKRVPQHHPHTTPMVQHLNFPPKQMPVGGGEGTDSRQAQAAAGIASQVLLGGRVGSGSGSGGTGQALARPASPHSLQGSGWNP
ncbi:protein KIBRA [Crotalus adamanteus]|uniref:Protein KIBRA n=1 Tax=Crotalus adamanteus TaxID=8729 RepID=A0AAW1B402_CROAD